MRLLTNAQRADCPIVLRLSAYCYERVVNAFSPFYLREVQLRRSVARARARAGPTNSRLIRNNELQVLKHGGKLEKGEFQVGFQVSEGIRGSNFALRRSRVRALLAHIRISPLQRNSTLLSEQIQWICMNQLEQLT